VVVASALFMPVVVGLGRTAGTRLGWVATVCGLACLLAGVGVGVYPMSQIRPHIVAALAYFWLYLGTTALYTLAFASRWNPRPSRLMMAAGVVCAFTAGLFLLMPKASARAALIQGEAFVRPAVWPLAVVEWCVIGSTCLWGGAAAWTVWRRAAGADVGG
jgi:hypothetical protein